MVEISVIIPIFNDEKYLRECLDSIFSQTLKDIEIICVNDGSTDSSAEILKEYSKNDKRIIILNQSNQGSTVARNTALDIARGEYIAFLDADDIYIDERSLETLLETARKSNAQMVSANLKFLTGKREIIDNPHYERGTFHYFDKYCEIAPDEYGIPFYFYKSIFRADLIADIRFPNLLRGGDPIFLCEILSKIDGICGVPIDFYGYMVPTSFDKLNTYTKKYHYICQYRQCIDMLDESGLSRTSDMYMHNLILYLSDTIDVEVYDIVCEVFDARPDYFKNYTDEYDAFRRANICNKILVLNSEEYYRQAREELGLEFESLSEYKRDYFKSQLDLKEKEFDELSKENERLKKEYDKEKSFNEEIINSRSWKLMNRLRKMRG